jgi:hypothetical protein
VVVTCMFAAQAGPGLGCEHAGDLTGCAGRHGSHGGRPGDHEHHADDWHIFIQIISADCRGPQSDPG